MNINPRILSGILAGVLTYLALTAAFGFKRHDNRHAEQYRCHDQQRWHHQNNH